MKRYIIISMVFLSISCSIFAATAPDQLGPYAVGVTTMRMEDPARLDPGTQQPRPLMVEVWYPTTHLGTQGRKNTLNDFFLGGGHPEFSMALALAFQSDLESVNKTFKTISYRDAPVFEGVFPLVLFSHGNGGMRSQNVFWCEHLASHGYIVVVPDHTTNCLTTGLAGEIIFFSDSKEARAQAAKDRPLDLIFILDEMDKINRGADSRFRGRIDMELIAAAGHSFGGYTVAAAADLEPRIDAIIPMAAVGNERSRYDCPVMILMATEDDTIKEKGNVVMRKYYADSQGPRYLVEFFNAGHYSFTEMYQFNPNYGDGCGKGKRITDGTDLTYIGMEKAFRLINGYTTAFLGKYIKGIRTYDAYLNTNHDPDEIQLKTGR